MAQLDVPGRYDVEGGTLMGFPLIGIGFNRHIAWTHTVSTSRRFILYQLHLVPGDPTSYLLDGKPTKMGRITVGVKFGGKTARTRSTRPAGVRWSTCRRFPATPTSGTRRPRTRCMTRSRPSVRVRPTSTSGWAKRRR